ncbi:MAG: hypothetical protein ACXAB7_07615 [Candidatus Kariarchaeaceae archaeon]|jgi:hypothetical protein
MSIGIDNINISRSVNSLEKFDIIKYASEQVKNNYYMVFATEKDETVSSLFLQLWRFDGGYDHAFINILESDFGLNKQVPVFIPDITQARIKAIHSYRPEKSTYTDKEEFFFDAWPESENKEKDEIHTLPFRCRAQLGGSEVDLIIPSWTPLQKIPVDRITEGSQVELWKVEEITNLMKVVKL